MSIETPTPVGAPVPAQSSRLALAPTASTAALDLAPLSRWRRLLPRWFRAMIWVEDLDRYDAFLSYSWQSDRQLAPHVQAVIQSFVRPWYKTRAKAVFRDLGSLPAGSSLQAELNARIDKSTHFVVLASPGAAGSLGMEAEAQHWFSRARAGETLILVTDGTARDWKEIRTTLLPVAVRENLQTEPLWIDIRHRRQRILSEPKDRQLQGELVEDIRQLLLRLHAPLDWGHLRGTERWQRRRALTLVSGTILVLVVLTAISLRLAVVAQHRAMVSLARSLASSSALQRRDHLDLALLLSVESFKASAIPAARSALLSSVEHNPQLSTFLHHDSGVFGIALSPNEQVLATGSADHRVVMWDLARRAAEAAPIEGHSNTVNGVTFSRDGSLLASASYDQTVRIWNVNRRAWQGPPLEGHDAAFSPDGGLIATATMAGAVKLWDAATGRFEFELLGQAGHSARMVSFSHDGKAIASADSNFVVRVWDLETRQLETKTLVGEFVAFSPDGLRLATSGGSEMWLWDASTFARSELPVLHSARLRSLAFNADGSLLLSASDDHTIRVWDVIARKQVAELMGHTGAVTQALFRSNGDVVSASEDGSVRFWRPSVTSSMGRPLRQKAGPLARVSYSQDGRWIIAASVSEGIKRWPIAADEAVPLPLPLPGVAMAPEPRGYGLAVGGIDGIVQLRDVNGATASGPPLPGPRRPVSAIVYSADGARVAVVYEGPDWSAQVWDTVTRERIGPAFAGTTAALSPNGQILAVAVGGDQAEEHTWPIEMFDVNSGAPIGPLLVGHRLPVSALAFSPDGKTLVSVSPDATLRIWDVETSQQRRQPISVVSSDQTPEGRFLGLSSVAFSPDGTLLAVGGQDHRVHLWDASTLESIGGPLQGHTDRVAGVALSPSSEQLASVSFDESVWLWDLSPASWIDRACQRANRNLSSFEWNQYLGAEVPYVRTCADRPEGSGTQQVSFARRVLATLTELL
jgi:WD40 repeat protein